MDIKSTEARSKNMAAVRSRNTKPELALRRALWRKGLRYFTAKGWQKLSGQRLPGSPDIVFPSASLVLFVDGCFWHGCPLHYQAPEDRSEFWRRKLKENQDRDAKVNEQLTATGWRVIRIWEHEIRLKVLPTTVGKIVTALQETSPKQ